MKTKHGTAKAPSRQENWNGTADKWPYGSVLLFVTTDEILNDVGALVAHWCDRRALKPLRYILSGYPVHSGLTDEWGQLLDAIKNIKAQCRADITPEELEKLSQLTVEVNKIVYR